MIEQTGGIAFISELTYGLPHFANVAAYAKVVKDKSLMRQPVKAASVDTFLVADERFADEGERQLDYRRWYMKYEIAILQPLAIAYAYNRFGERPLLVYRTFLEALSTPVGEDLKLIEEWQRGRWRAMQGFRSFRTAERTLEGLGAMHMVRKGQVKRLDGRDAAGQAKFVESLFGVAA